ncbi:sugar ABC transporter substrate-binding protein, partial [Streptococcus agalactiae]
AYKGSDKVWVDSNKTFAIKHFVEMIDYAQIRPYSNATTKWEDKVYEELKPAYLGKESLEKAVKKITKTMNRALEREK